MKLFSLFLFFCSVQGAGIAQSVQRQATGRTAGVRFPARAGEFSTLHSVQICSGAHTVSYPISTGGFFPVG
jgi:hypothetical protein